MQAIEAQEVEAAEAERAVHQYVQAALDNQRSTDAWFDAICTKVREMLEIPVDRHGVYEYVASTDYLTDLWLPILIMVALAWRHYKAAVVKSVKVATCAYASAVWIFVIVHYIH